MRETITYEYVCNFLKENGLDIVSTKEEFEEQKKINSHKKFYYKAECDHCQDTCWQQFQKIKNKKLCVRCNTAINTYYEIVEFLKKKQMQILSTQQDFFEKDQEPRRRIITYLPRCNHKQTATQHQLIVRKNIEMCQECNNDTFQQIAQYMQEHNLQLITSRQDFDQQNGQKSSRQIKFLAECQHECQIMCKDLNRKNYQNQYLCTKCIIQKNKNINPHETELQGIEFLQELVQQKYQIQRSQEGSKFDILLKKNDQLKYLKAQIKVTQQCKQSSFCFTRCKGYKNMIIILISLRERKIWMLFDNNIKRQTISISKNQESIYDQYFIHNNQIIKQLDEYYKQESLLCSLDDSYNCSSKYTQIANNFIKLRQQKIDFLEFVQPQIQHGIHDFSVNNQNFQEKVSQNICRQTNYIYAFGLAKVNQRKKIPYEIGDNDYYWFNINNPKKHIFYVIPEEILIEKGYIKTQLQKGKIRIDLNLENNSKVRTKQWIFEYMFDYEDIDKDKLINLIYKN